MRPNRHLILSLFFLLMIKISFAQQTRFFVVNTDSVQQYSILAEYKKTLIDSVHLGQRELLLQAIDSLQSDFVKHSKLCHSVESQQQGSENLQKRMELFKTIEEQLGIIENMADSLFQVAVLEQVNELFLERFVTNVEDVTHFLIDSSAGAILAVFGNEDIFITNQIIIELENSPNVLPRFRMLENLLRQKVQEKLYPNGNELEILLTRYYKY